MSYGEKVLSRLNIPGLLLLCVGAVVAYGSGKIAEKWFSKYGNKANIIIKVVGLAFALLGALILLDLIG